MNKEMKKQLGYSKTQKGGNNGFPINPKPKILRPAPPKKKTSQK